MIRRLRHESLVQKHFTVSPSPRLSLDLRWWRLPVYQCEHRWPCDWGSGLHLPSSAGYWADTSYPGQARHLLSSLAIASTLRMGDPRYSVPGLGRPGGGTERLLLHLPADCMGGRTQSMQLPQGADRQQEVGPLRVKVPDCGACSLSTGLHLTL